MVLPFLQGAVCEVFTDKNVLVEGESTNLMVEIAQQNVDNFEYDGTKAYTCTWDLQEGYGNFSQKTGGTTTFKTPNNLPVATAIATITVTLTPTETAQNKAPKAGFTFSKVILYIRLQQTNKLRFYLLMTKYSK